MTFVLDPLLFFPGMPQVSFKSHSLYFWPDFVGCWPRQVLACTGFSQPALPLGSYSPLICLSPRQQPGGMFVCGGLFLHLRILPSHDSTLKFKASLQLFEQLSKAPGPPLSLCLLRKGRSERSQFTSFGVEMGSKSLGSACWKIPASLWWRSCALLRISRGAVTLRQVQRGFFFHYCLCQLAAQGYCQLSVRALIFVSYGQVLLVICYLFSFVQPELHLSTN